MRALEEQKEHSLMEEQSTSVVEASDRPPSDLQVIVEGCFPNCCHLTCCSHFLAPTFNSVCAYIKLR